MCSGFKGFVGPSIATQMSKYLITPDPNYNQKWSMCLYLVLFIIAEVVERTMPVETTSQIT